LRTRKREVVRLSRNWCAGSTGCPAPGSESHEAPEDARDVYQEAFLKVYRKPPPFPLRVQLLHLALPHRHQRLPGPPAPPSGAPEDQAPELNSGLHEEGITDFFERQREQRPTLDPERTFIGKEIKARIAIAMERLSLAERIVFEMKHYQGLKLRAIGDALGTTEETVKNSLSAPRANSATSWSLR